jgi:hypothetical protein
MQINGEKYREGRILSREYKWIGNSVQGYYYQKAEFAPTGKQAHSK